MGCPTSPSGVHLSRSGCSSWGRRPTLLPYPYTQCICSPHPTIPLLFYSSSVSLYSNCNLAYSIQNILYICTPVNDITDRISSKLRNTQPRLSDPIRRPSECSTIVQFHSGVDTPALTNILLRSRTSESWRPSDGTTILLRSDSIVSE